MNRYKICVYAICKNEEKFVDKWVDSMSEADLIVVADTGSTDHTKAKLSARGVSVYDISVQPWRFDLPRNLCMDFIPEDVDICVSTDLDEVFDPGWRKKIEAHWTPQTTRLKYSYTFGFYPDGTPIITYAYEKIHRRHDFRWIYPVHEILEYSGSDPDVYAIDMSIHLKHYPDTSKSRGQYLHLLELSAQEFPLYDRNIHYLGREYMFHHRYDEAIATLLKHLSLPTALWADERCASMRFISECYKVKGNLGEAIKWLYKAIGEAPYLREPYIEMAQLAYETGDWIKGYHMITSALTITTRTGSYLDLDSSWGYLPYDLGAICCYQLGLYSQSLTFATEALKLDPLNPRLQSNYDLIKKLAVQS